VAKAVTYLVYTRTDIGVGPTNALKSTCCTSAFECAAVMSDPPRSAPYVRAYLVGPKGFTARDFFQLTGYSRRSRIPNLREYKTYLKAATDSLNLQKKICAVFSKRAMFFAVLTIINLQLARADLRIEPDRLPAGPELRTLCKASG
jgi:hypothetical protein